MTEDRGTLDNTHAAQKTRAARTKWQRRARKTACQWGLWSAGGNPLVLEVTHKDSLTMRN